MGILSFYGEYLADIAYPRVHAGKIPSTVLSLSMDMNGILHQCAQVVYAYGDGYNRERARLIAMADPMYIELEYFQTIAKRLGEIITAIKPTQFLVLAIDGVAPLAKISQQRGRRYKSSIINKETGVQLGSVPKPAFDPNCITPGTPLMMRLDQYLQRWIVTNRDFLPSKIIYSSHMVRGEGEHKIFEFIRQGLLQSEDTGANVIYGLDADLVMLSSLSQIQWLYLCRESLTDIINIDALKVGIIEDLSVKGLNAMDPIIAIQDFVVMLYLIGNDFLPHMVAFHHVGKSINVMFSIYQNLKAPLTSHDGQILWDNFGKFVSILSEREPILLHEVASKEFRFPSRAIELATDRVPDRSGEPKIEFDYDKFRLAWYRFSIAPRTPEAIRILEQLELQDLTAKDIQDMCVDYMQGLQWILQYYTKGTHSISRSYVYKYNHAPLLKDLALMIQYGVAAGTTPTLSMVEAKLTDPLFTPIHQLLAVMPPASISLLPAEYHHLVQGGPLTDLCPLDFIVELEGKNKDWQGIAILPNLNPHRVIEAVDTVTYGLIPSEYEDKKDIIIENVNKLTHHHRGSRGHRNESRGRGASSDRNASRGRGARGGGDRGRGRGRGRDPTSHQNNYRGKMYDGKGRGRGRGQLRPHNDGYQSRQPSNSEVDTTIPHIQPRKATRNWTDQLLM